MYSPTLERTINGWTLLADTLVVPHTEAGYERLVAMVDELIDTVGEKEDHPRSGLMEPVGVLVENYENRHIPESEGDPLTTLRFLMDEHGIDASALTEIGNERVVRQILDGTAALTMPQIRLLAQRFNVAPGASQFWGKFCQSHERKQVVSPLAYARGSEVCYVCPHFGTHPVAPATFL